MGDHNQKNTVDHAHGLPPLLAIDDPVQAGEVEGIEEDAERGIERNPMFFAVRAILRSVPCKSHCIYIIAYTEVGGKKTEQGAEISLCCL